MIKSLSGSRVEKIVKDETNEIGIPAKNDDEFAFDLEEGILRIFINEQF